MKVEYIEHWGSDLTPVNAARVSFDKESDWERQHWDPVTLKEDVELRELSAKDAKLIHYLAKNKHTSCFEHQGATLRLKVPIFIARQIQRHRTFSYNEVSRRYVKDNLEFYLPDKWRKAADNVKQGSSDEEVPDGWALSAFGLAGTCAELEANMVVRTLKMCYENMLEHGVAPEQARMLLPQNLYTSFYMSGNLRAWSHFLSLRLDSHAQKEVQDVAQQVADILKPLYPVSMEALLEYA